MTLICAKYVLLGILGALAAGAVSIGAVAAFIWLAVQTTALVGLPEKYGLLVFLGYILAPFGAAFGALACHEARREAAE